MQRWFPISLIITGLVLVTIIFQFNISNVYASNGQKLFKDKGCGACHYTDKGRERKPYPTKQVLANAKFKQFKKVIKNGKAGTAMPSYKLDDKQIEAIYNWLQNYK